MEPQLETPGPVVSTSATTGSAVSETTPPVVSDQQSSNAADFDRGAIEVAFGLPPGTLADAVDEAAAISAVRDYTDKTLLAGIGLEPNFGTGKTVQPKATDTTAAVTTPGVAAAAQASGNEEIEALRAKFAKFEARFNEQQAGHIDRLMSELDRRAMAEVDSWASPKYGVSGSRNYKQTKAAAELTGGLAKTQVAGLQATGQAVPTIEVILRRARAFDDDTYTPPKPKTSADSIGTPGARREEAGANAPRNIHAALMGSKS